MGIFEGENMKILHCALLIASLSLLSSCDNKKKSAAWNSETKLKQNKMGHPLWKGEGNPRMVQDGSELTGPTEEGFIALQDDDLRAAHLLSTPQPRFTPGEAGSGLPHLANYQTVDSPLFAKVHFDTDNYSLGPDEKLQLKKLANHLNKNPLIYLSVSGHCDERGLEQYNQALGAKRANVVRDFLVLHGVNPERIHTISYGKEMPAVEGHGEDAWAENRRSEFKIYNKAF